MALLPTDSGTLAALLVNIETIKFQLAKAEREGPIDPLRTRDPERDLAGALKLVPTRNSEKWHPVLVIHQVMLRCGDEAAHEASAEFRFVQDPDVRQELLTDLNTARSALRNAEWKPATVIAGALAEALLLWAVDQHQSAEITQAIGHVRTAGTLSSAPSGDRDRWGLEELTAVAQALGVVQPKTFDLLKLTQECRNLIHPGRARRKLSRCDRSTALTANGGMERLSSDLEAKFNT